MSISCLLVGAFGELNFFHNPVLYDIFRAKFRKIDKNQWPIIELDRLLIIYI